MVWPSSLTPIRAPRLGMLLIALLISGSPLLAHSQGASTKSKTSPELTWSQLTPRQRDALAPLEREWRAIDGHRREKWVEIADRYHRLSPSEQARVRDRMSDWARMSPKERGEARMNYESARQRSGLQDRRARWEAYQALSPEQRQALAERARRDNAADTSRRAKSRAPEGTNKSNLVPNTSYATRPRPVSPSVVQAAPGATTNLITQKPVPPAHQQTGLPKVTATPGFVDRATLLPQRGPQGAAVRAAPSPRRDQDRNQDGQQ